MCVCSAILFPISRPIDENDKGARCKYYLLMVSAQLIVNFLSFRPPKLVTRYYVDDLLPPRPLQPLRTGLSKWLEILTLLTPGQ